MHWHVPLALKSPPATRKYECRQSLASLQNLYIFRNYIPIRTVIRGQGVNLPGSGKSRRMQPVARNRCPVQMPTQFPRNSSASRQELLQGRSRFSGTLKMGAVTNVVQDLQLGMRKFRPVYFGMAPWHQPVQGP